MKSLKKTLFSALFALTLVVSPAFAGLASASGSEQIIQVSGTFQTQQPIPSPLCTGLDDCVVDDLTGSFAGGTNRLVTAGFVENDSHIVYHDVTRIDTHGYGVFEGNEYGLISKSTEHFDSISRTVSTDGCGSTLTIHFSGTIDLDSENLEDAGSFSGILVKRTC